MLEGVTPVHEKNRYSVQTQTIKTSSGVIISATAGKCDHFLRPADIVGILQLESGLGPMKPTLCRYQTRHVFGGNTFLITRLGLE